MALDVFVILSHSTFKNFFTQDIIQNCSITNQFKLRMVTPPPHPSSGTLAASLITRSDNNMTYSCFVCKGFVTRKTEYSPEVSSFLHWGKVIVTRG